MRNRVKQWLEPPNFAGDAEKTARARVMNTLNIYIMLMLLLILFVFVPFFVVHKEESWFITLVLLAFIGVSRRFLARGQLSLASTFMIAPAWVVLMAIAVIGGGISSPIMLEIRRAHV